MIDVLNLIQDMVILTALGLCGWALLKLLHFPIAPLLGAIIVIGSLRVLDFPIPTSPPFLLPLAQIFLGIFVGSKLNRNTVKQLKEMASPAAIIIIWAIGVAFGLGFILAKLTYLDLYTAILSSSMGGLPEMTVISLATNAKTEIVIVMQASRMIITAVAFPLLLKLFIRNGCNHGEETRGSSLNEDDADADADTNSTQEYWSRLIITLAAALGGGALFHFLGVPAGAMVGSMVFIAAVSIAGVKVITLSSNIFGLLLMGIGITVADNITQETVSGLMSGSLLFVIILSAVLIFLSSLLVAVLIAKITGWDYPTSFLAAAPAGLMIMTMLAVKYERNPFRVSSLHLCRLIAIKSILPLVFMMLI